MRTAQKDITAVISQKDIAAIIRELDFMEQHALQFAEKCRRQRQDLERFHAPAPKRGTPLSTAEVMNLRAGIRQSILRKAKGD